MFILTFDVESAYALNPNLESELEETLASVTQITQLLKNHEVPATFFIVGKVIERAGQDLSNLLDDSFLFDIGSHTYSHMEILSVYTNTKNKFKNELIKTSKLILKHFDKEPLGFCAPGGFFKGLRGYPEQPMPALFTQPYWLTQDGFSDGWQPSPGFVDGTILAKLPKTLEEGFQVRRKEFQYAIDNNLVYGPAMHPWSVYRFDPELK